MHAHVFSNSSLYLAVKALNLTVGARITRRGLANGNTSPLAHRCERPFEFLTSIKTTSGYHITARSSNKTSH